MTCHRKVAGCFLIGGYVIILIDKEGIKETLKDIMGFNDKDGTYYFYLERIKQSKLKVDDFGELGEDDFEQLANNFYNALVNKKK